MEPKTLGSLFVYLYRYPSGTVAPVVNTSGWTRETSAPFRSGNNWLIRLPFTRWALVIGQWFCTYGDDLEDEALVNAMDGRFLRLTAEDIRTWH